MEIRLATAADLPQLNRLLYQVADVHHRGRPDLFKPKAKKYTDEQLLALLDNPDYVIFVGAEGERVLCHLFCIVEEIKNENCLADRRTLYIDDLCVDAACRGQGVGQQMYAFIKTWAKEQGFYNITLNVWSCNPSALKFYEKLGLVPQKIGMEEIL